MSAVACRPKGGAHEATAESSVEPGRGPSTAPPHGTMMDHMRCFLHVDRDAVPCVGASANEPANEHVAFQRVDGRKGQYERNDALNGCMERNARPDRIWQLGEDVSRGMHGGPAQTVVDSSVRDSLTADKAEPPGFEPAQCNVSSSNLGNSRVALVSSCASVCCTVVLEESVSSPQLSCLRSEAETAVRATHRGKRGEGARVYSWTGTAEAET